MNLGDFDYHLPDELIAQAPPEDRAGARMLVLDRAGKRWEDRRFRDLPAFLRPGDCLVLNDSRVFPARLYGHRAGVRALPVGKSNPKLREHLSGRVEVFLLRPASGDSREWEALVRPGRKMRHGNASRSKVDWMARSWRAANSASAPSGSTARATCSRSSKRWATCRCRPISSAPTTPPTASATRRFSRARKAPWRRPLPAAFHARILDECRARGAERRGHAARGAGNVSTAARGASGAGQPACGAVRDRRERRRQNARRDSAWWWWGPPACAPSRAPCARAMAAVERRDGYLHLPRLRISGRRRHADQLPFAADQPAAAGVRFRGDGTGAGGLPACGGERYRFYSYGDCMLIV